MANVKIILIVDTEKIHKKGEHHSCIFVDNTHHMDKYDPEKYETFIRPGQMIEWSGLAKNPETCDLVSIDSISMDRHHHSKDLFGIPILIGSGGKIIANILAKEPSRNSETYTLRFTVIINKTGHNHSYSIDPKLKIDNDRD